MHPLLRLQNDLRWQAVQQRDKRQDGRFVFAVRTTGIFCRPSCASRPAKRENVDFFASAPDALAHGYRPCKRCRPDQDASILNSAWVRDAATYIEQHAQSPQLLTRTALSQRFYLSPGHLQIVFKQVMGMTPAQYARTVRQQRLREALTSSENATEAVFEAGYSSLSQAYDKGGVLGMTPRQYQRKGAGMTIRYAAIETAYGWMLVAATEWGLCTVSLHDSHEAALVSLQTEFSEADLVVDTAVLAETVQQIVAHIEGSLPSLDLPTDVQATAFQMRVWNALRQIPRGETWSYSELAEHIGDPKATRAVAAACGANHLAVVIPCHRVVSKSGNLTGYKWGVERKRLLLAREQDQRSLFDK